MSELTEAIAEKPLPDKRSEHQSVIECGLAIRIQLRVLNEIPYAAVQLLSQANVKPSVLLP
ncbi:hypothetical protein MCC02031_02400 [Bifidobacteriaceae bacterium MCC02031]|nr:hypothetical protein MCC02031_02400 [Bifidobacteriaceae bacterium MCC02031]